MCQQNSACSNLCPCQVGNRSSRLRLPANGYSTHPFNSVMYDHIQNKNGVSKPSQGASFQPHHSQAWFHHSAATASLGINPLYHSSAVHPQIPPLGGLYPPPPTAGFSPHPSPRTENVTYQSKCFIPKMRSSHRGGVQQVSQGQASPIDVCCSGAKTTKGKKRLSRKTNGSDSTVPIFLTDPKVNSNRKNDSHNENETDRKPS